MLVRWFVVLVVVMMFCGVGNCVWFVVFVCSFLSVCFVDLFNSVVVRIPLLAFIYV